MTLAVGLAPAQEGLFGTHYKPVVVNTKASGAGVTTDIRSFPLLLRLDSANASDLFAQAAPAGIDLRVTNAGGTNPVPFELESWNAAAKRAVLWILADLVKGSDSAQSYRLYWGRSGAVSNSDPATVFDTANGFQAVFHMGGRAGDEHDAGLNGFTATAVNAPGDTMGVIGNSRRLNGVDQRFQISGSSAGRLNFQLADSYTLSAWVGPAAIATGINSGDVDSVGNKIIDKGDNQYNLGVYDGAVPKYWTVSTRANSTYLFIQSNDPPLAANEAVGSWHHIAGTFHGAPRGEAVAESLFVDGSLAGKLSALNGNDNGRNTTFNVSIGAQLAGTAPQGTLITRFWNGALDEVRLENRARSADWIKLSYESQKPGTTTVALGAAPTALAPASLMPNPFVVRSVAGGVLFDASAFGTLQSLEVVDLRGRRVWRTSAIPPDQRLYWKTESASPGTYFVRFNGAATGGSKQTFTRAFCFLP